MTPDFLAAVIDTLLPGDDVLPSGTGAGVGPSSDTNGHLDLLDAIAVRAGSAETFVRLDAGARTALLHAIEREKPDGFRALLVALLTDYYESAAVLVALGWSDDPPQPIGHAVPSIDCRTASMIDRVGRRNRLWHE